MVIRVEKNKNYTTMSNYHLRDKNLSLKSKGLLSLFLSLPDSWRYSIKGLTQICKEGRSGIASALNELEDNGYLVRERHRDDQGLLRDITYVIYEKPHKPETDHPDISHEEEGHPESGNLTLDHPESENLILDYPESGNPALDHPELDNPTLEDPALENLPQLNKEETSKERTRKEELNTESINLSGDGNDGMDSYRRYREYFIKQLDFDVLLTDYPYEQEALNEILDLLVETMCSNKKMIRVCGDDKPGQVVKSQLMKLNIEHIRYVMHCMDENTTKITNIKQYLLAALYNAPMTISNYYGALVQHDMYGN